MNILKSKAARITLIILCLLGIPTLLIIGGFKALEYSTKDMFKCTHEQQLTDPNCMQ